MLARGSRQLLPFHDGQERRLMADKRGKGLHRPKRNVFKKDERRGEGGEIQDRTHSHSAAIRLRIHGLAGLAERRQQLEVVDIECRGVGVEELGRFVVRIREGMWRPRWHGDVVSQFGVDCFAIQTVKAECPLRYEEGLIVLFDWWWYRVSESAVEQEFG